MGQSDAAWALLGTTVRLAQTMGLHTERSTIHWPENVRTKARTLWYDLSPLSLSEIFSLPFRRADAIQQVDGGLARQFTMSLL